MSNSLFLAAFLGIPLVFVGLDLFDHHASRGVGKPGTEVPGWETFLFLAAVFAVYGAINIASTAFAPSAPELMEAVGGHVARFLGRPLHGDPLRGGWLAGVCAATFYLLGLWDYALHRWFSHNQRFFFTHEYHHVPNQIAVTVPGLAVRPFSVVVTLPATFATVVCVYVLLAAFGLPLWDLAPLKILILVHMFLGIASHSSFMRRGWWAHHTMKWLALTTPQEHLLHHTVDLKGNYGNVTTLWDRVFGTYLDPTRPEHQGHRLGLPYDQDFLGAITAGKLKLPRSLRRRFRVERYCNVDED